MSGGWAGSSRKARLPANWTTLRRQVLLGPDGQRRTCSLPGCEHPATDVDHRVPGDDHSLGNLAPVCRCCHNRKSSAEGVSARAAQRARRMRGVERHPGRG